MLMRDQIYIENSGNKHNSFQNGEIIWHIRQFTVQKTVGCLTLFSFDVRWQSLQPLFVFFDRKLKRRSMR